jgi:hypothetical protein
MFALLNKVSNNSFSAYVSFAKISVRYACYQHKPSCVGRSILSCPAALLHLVYKIVWFAKTKDC